MQPYWWGHSSKCHPDLINQNSTLYPTFCISSYLLSPKDLCLQEGGLTFDLSLIDCLLFDLKRDDECPLSVLLLVKHWFSWSCPQHAFPLTLTLDLYFLCAHSDRPVMGAIDHWDSWANEVNITNYSFILLWLYCCTTFCILFYCNIAYRWLYLCRLSGINVSMVKCLERYWECNAC